MNTTTFSCIRYQRMSSNCLAVSGSSISSAKYRQHKAEHRSHKLSLMMFFSVPSLSPTLYHNPTANCHSSNPPRPRVRTAVELPAPPASGTPSPSFLTGSFQMDSDHLHDRSHEDHPERVSRNARNGLILFALYLALYAGFMYLSAFQPQLMATAPFGGVNLAILYGFTLIIAALLLALIYMALCKRT